MNFCSWRFMDYGAGLHASLSTLQDKNSDLLCPREPQLLAEFQHGKNKKHLFDEKKHGNAFNVKDLNLHKSYREPASVVALLKACAEEEDLIEGSKLHADIIRRDLLDKNDYVSNSLINMYAKCGSFSQAQEVLEGLQVHKTVSWNALISGYVQYGHAKKAIECYEEMLVEGLPPSATTYVCILKACGILGATDKGQEIHAAIARQGVLGNNIMLGTALIDMYAKCSVLARAKEVFDELPSRNRVSWNALITGYAQHGNDEEAVRYFDYMQLEGIRPDTYTYACTLKACGGRGALKRGQVIHVQIVRHGLLDKDIVVGNALVDMYAKCNALSKAAQVLYALPLRDVVTWTALLTGYAEHGCCTEAVGCFECIQRDGFSPSTVSYACVLKVCGSVGDLCKGQELHAKVVIQDLLEKCTVIGNALLDMYAKCNALVEAQYVFDMLPMRDAISWNTLIAAYTQCRHDEEAIKCFQHMRDEGFPIDPYTFSCILKACGSVGASKQGQEIYNEIVKLGMLRKDAVLGNALMDMHAKCGALADAQEVFDTLAIQDVVSWNSLIAGYALVGKDPIVFNLYDKMIAESMMPDLVTFTVLLNACSHCGLLDKSEWYFEAMSSEFGIAPTLEHHFCLADLYCRAGHLGKSMTIIKLMPFSPTLIMWHIILGACQKWSNVSLGKVAFRHAVNLDEKNAGTYVCIGNIFAAAGMHEDANKIELLRLEKQAFNQWHLLSSSDRAGIHTLF